MEELYIYILTSMHERVRNLNFFDVLDLKKIQKLPLSPFYDI